MAKDVSRCRQQS
jgi:hypothetical protein